MVTFFNIVNTLCLNVYEYIVWITIIIIIVSPLFSPLVVSPPYPSRFAPNTISPKSFHPNFGNVVDACMFMLCIVTNIHVHVFILKQYSLTSTYEPQHDKTNKMSVRPAKTLRWAHTHFVCHWAHSQADLSLHWVHSYFFGFVISWLNYIWI